MGQSTVFNIGGISIPCEICTKKKLKYIRLTIDNKGLRVSLPYGINEIQVERFLREKEKWIFEHYMKFQSEQCFRNDRTWIDHEIIQYRGKTSMVSIYDYDFRETRVNFDGEKFEVYVDKNLTGQDRKAAVEDALKRMLLKISREVIGERLIYFSNVIGVSYNKVRIKDQKTRWGSCSGKGNLNFNWRLVMVPDFVLDYVVVHELCHLKHLNHSKEFWDMVACYIPQFRSARDWLKTNGGSAKLRD